jgi:hypothetical protein
MTSHLTEISDAEMQAMESHCCCSSSASHNKILVGMLEPQTEWAEWWEWWNGWNGRNGGNCGNSGMAEWWNGGDGMVKWQKWLHMYYLRYTPTLTPMTTMMMTTMMMTTTLLSFIV